MTITKERVLEAAEKNPWARETLKTLFPECFESGIEIVRAAPGVAYAYRVDGIKTLSIESSGEYAGKGFHLESDLNWRIEKHKGIGYTLIPTKK